MKPRHKRLAFVAGGIAGLAVVAALIFTTINDNMMFFFSPSDVLAKKAPLGRDFRLGGLVEEGSMRRENDGLTVHFMVTDQAQSIPVTFVGILPDLFKEGQGVIAQGKLGLDGSFMADEVLAKHDENYIAPEVADALERAKDQNAVQTVSTPKGGI